MKLSTILLPTLLLACTAQKIPAMETGYAKTTVGLIGAALIAHKAGYKTTAELLGGITILSSICTVRDLLFYLKPASFKS